MSKYPNCEKLGLIINTPSGPILNENRFFIMTDYNSFREFEDSSSYKSKWNVSNERKLSDVEKFLENKLCA
jgi:hypothetical protein